MPLQLRRGSETTISALTPANGEPLWAEDTHKLFIGDGTTVGGHEIGGGGGAQGAQGYQGYQGHQGVTGAQGLTGAQGNQGDTGAQGLQGAQGSSGGFTTGSDAVVGILTATNRIHVDKIYNYNPGGSAYVMIENDEANNLNLNVGNSNSQIGLGSYILQFDAPGKSVVSGYDRLELFGGVRGTGPSVDSAGVRLGLGDSSTATITLFANSANNTETNIIAFSGTNITSYTHIVPDQDSQYDLGTSSRKWRSLYVSTQTIYIGTSSLTIADGQLSVNGGTIGAQGLQGHQGNQGNQGDTGAQGLQGHQGDTGAQGLQGYQGDTGAQGLQGHQGDTGAQGLQGHQGNQGFQGAQGVQGGFASGSDAIVATLTATQKLDVTTGTNISRSLVIGGEGVQGNGYYYAAVSSTNPTLLMISNAASGTQGRITARTYGQNQPGGGATTVPAAQIIMEGSRGTHTAPTAIQSGDPLGGLNFGGYDGSAWSVGDRNLGPAQILVTSAEAWAASGNTATNQGCNFLFRDQPLGIQLTSTSRRGWMRTSQTAVGGSPPTLVLSFNDNSGSTPTLTSSTGGTTFTGHGRMQANWINASQNMIAVTSADSAPDNNNLTGANFLQFIGVRKNAMSGRRNKLLLGDTIWQINFNGVTSDSNTGNGVTMAQIYASALENVSTTAYGSDLVFKTVTKASTAIADRLKLASDSITIGSSESLVVKTNSYNLQDSSANDIVTYTTGTDQVSILKKTSMTTATISTVLNLPIRTSEPAGKVAGSIVFADGNSWDPANYSTLTVYLTWYDGSNWRAIASV